MLYTGLDLILYFFFYAFLGWCGEVAVLAVSEHRFGNRGVLNSPICCIYGFTMNTIIIATSLRQENIVIQYLLCFTTAAAVNALGSHISRRMFGKVLWDYEGSSALSGNVSGLLINALMAGILLTCLKLLHPLIYLAVHMLPDRVVRILSMVLVIAFVLDVLSVFFLAHAKKKLKDVGKLEEDLLVSKLTFSRMIYRHIWKRLNRAYPEMAKMDTTTNSLQREDLQLQQQGICFARGLCLDKVIWIFLLCAFIGDIIETFYVRAVGGVWMRRSSLVFGPFSVVWGIGAAILTIVLQRLVDKEDRYIFLGGFLLGGTYEYLCSVFTEAVFGTVFWDYSSMPFNIGGRTNLLFMLFWGILSLVWVKLCYPRISAVIEKIPPITGKVFTWFLMGLMICNILVTSAVMIRYDQRKNTAAAAQAGTSITAPAQTELSAHLPGLAFIDSYIDHYYPDDTVKKLWPNLLER